MRLPLSNHVGCVAFANPGATTILSEPSARTVTRSLFSSRYATRLPSGAHSASTTLLDGIGSVVTPPPGVALAKCSWLSPIETVSLPLTPGNDITEADRGPGDAPMAAGASPYPAAMTVAAAVVIFFADTCYSPVLGCHRTPSVSIRALRGPPLGDDLGRSSRRGQLGFTV